MAAKLAEVEQARQELVQERSQVAALFQEREELALSSSIELNRRMQANNRAYRAEEG